MGGSTLLYFHGIAERFNDVDLMIALKDVQSAREALLGMGAQERPAVKSDRFRTVSYQKWTLEALEIDLMAGFTILKDGQAHAFPLTAETVAGSVLVNGVSAPMQALAVWQECYALMDRPEKASLIERYRREQAAAH